MKKEAKPAWDSISGASTHPGAGGSLAFQADGQEWYAIQTRYRFEKKVTASLERRGIETFIPLLEEIHRWSDREKGIQVPLFSGYTFVRLELSARMRRAVLQTEGVIGFVGSGTEVPPVPSRQLEDLRKLLSQKVPCALAAFLVVGQRVRIRSGCLDGLEGILEQNDAKRLVISVEAIRRAIAIQIDGYELELI